MMRAFTAPDGLLGIEDGAEAAAWRAGLGVAGLDFGTCAAGGATFAATRGGTVEARTPMPGVTGARAIVGGVRGIGGKDGKGEPVAADGAPPVRFNSSRISGRTWGGRVAVGRQLGQLPKLSTRAPHLGHFGTKPSDRFASQTFLRRISRSGCLSEITCHVEDYRQRGQRSGFRPQNATPETDGHSTGFEQLAQLAGVKSALGSDNQRERRIGVAQRREALTEPDAGFPLIEHQQASARWQSSNRV